MTAQDIPTDSAASAPQPAARDWTGILIGAAILIALTVLVAELDIAIKDFFAERDISSNPLEYPLIAVLIGLAANAALRATGLYQRIRPAIRTELFLKVGLVLLGARISLGDLVSNGAGGLIQALIMVTSVFAFTWWLSGRFNLPPTLRAVMASAVSVCGVSAAIAAAGAVIAKKEEVTYITALVILTALPLMVVMPWVADALGLSETVAGAWFGGNIDTTAAVVGAGTLYGEKAQEVASVVKLAQNVLIGVVAFGLAFYFAAVVERDTSIRPSPRMLWDRFPKFVIGFVLVSILASVDLLSAGQISEIRQANNWAFALAFVAIGIEFAPGAVFDMGRGPITVYLAATVFNTVLALVAALVIFGALGMGS
jgi:uncharacterized membrane protein YadS